MRGKVATADELYQQATEFEKLAAGAKDAREKSRATGLYYGFAGWEKGWIAGTEKELKEAGVTKIRKALPHDNNEAKEKLDPKAKVRNRGTVCVPAEQAKDKKDHFPINDEGQARSALSRVEGLTSAPWYRGSLDGLRALVKRKVHSKYPSIGKDKKKSKACEVSDDLLNKYANLSNEEIQSSRVR